MIKTVKGKVIAGTMAFGLVAGGGVAFGASEAGANLKSWYEGQFGTTTQAVTDQVAAHALGKVDGLTTEYNGLKTAATNSIDTTRGMATTVGTTNINEQSAEHIAAINQQKVAISNAMAAQFDKLSRDAANLINETGTAGLRAATNDLTSHTDAKGAAALTAVTTDLGNAKGAAVGELQTAITNAKSELQTQLAREKALTVTEINGLIDAKIIELRRQITKIKNDLVATQQGLITAKAIELEKAAKAEMATLVNGINK
ncbi:hypothetical protein [Sporosarcina sp. JAI121]|uniref:hypothetical protein n=1 Tax=Sporosarcina sp. JAI121 TaxID=2723064 RepID=UPI0015C9F31A|nr:hypothetical protein [Sporosarcina sp. JAI121]NYF23615.1 hypothetical protein [Sporosarcina sp. JAI121]